MVVVGGVSIQQTGLQFLSLAAGKDKGSIQIRTLSLRAGRDKNCNPRLLKPRPLDLCFTSLSCRVCVCVAVVYLDSRFSSQTHCRGPLWLEALLGGSWVVISRILRVITHIRGLITLAITTHEPPSKL